MKKANQKFELIRLTFFLAVLVLAASVNIKSQENYSVTTGTGTLTDTASMTKVSGNGCDDCSIAVNLPFDYRFYDQTYAAGSAINLTANGILIFGAGNTSSANVCLPSPNPNLNRSIFAAWDNWLTTGGADYGIWTKTEGAAPNRVFKIVWKTRFVSGSTTFVGRFEVRLFEKRKHFDIIYGTMSGSGNLVTAGVQRDSTYFTGYSCNSPVLNDGLRLTFAQPDSAPVLSGVPSAQSVLWGNPVSFTAAATDLDLPHDELTFSLSGAVPTGAAINPASGAFSWTPSGGQSGSHSFAVVVTDARGISNQQNITITVNKRPAAINYNGTLYKATASSSQNTADVALSAIIKDISEINPPAPTPGNITTAAVDFVNLEDYSILAGNVPVTLINNNDSTIGSVSAPITLNTGGANAKTFNIGIFVTGYYDRVATEDNILVTIAKPVSTNFISGGGFLTMQNAVGATVNSRADFGFSVKHGANGSNPAGSFTILCRQGGAVYQISGSTYSSLIVNNSNPLSRTAVLNATGANVTDITNPLAPVVLPDSYSVRFKLTDKGEPGTSDSIGITIWDSNNNLWFSSRTDGAGNTLEQTLDGSAGTGNLVFRYISSPR